jgi:fructokinase
MTIPPRPLIFGEVLFDLFPDGTEVLGGAPFNVAWHLQAFHHPPMFLSRVGNDALGRAIRSAMQDWGMDTAGLQMDSSFPTGTVRVALEQGEPTFDIVAERAYDRIDAAALPPLQAGALLYHGTLALREEPSREALLQIRAGLQPRVFVDVNLRAPWWERRQALELLEGATWVKINAAELAELVPEPSETGERARRLQERFALETLYVTEGAAGAFARTRGGETLRVKPAGGIEVVDAVGAGDAFASVLILGILEGWPLGQTLERAQAFASAMVGQRGATVQDPGFYRETAADWGLSEPA